MPSNRDLKVSVEGDITTAAGNWFQIRIVVGKKLVEGIGTPSWNTGLTTVSSRILSVWSQIQWCRYCDQSIDYSVHQRSWHAMRLYSVWSIKF